MHSLGSSYVMISEIRCLSNWKQSAEQDGLKRNGCRLSFFTFQSSGAADHNHSIDYCFNTEQIGKYIFEHFIYMMSVVQLRRRRGFDALTRTLPDRLDDGTLW